MRRFVQALVFALCLSTNLAASRPAILSSVAGLAWTDTDFWTGLPVTSNHCTAWSLNEDKHYWATAAHCVLDQATQTVEARDYKIMNDSASLVAVDPEDDLAVLQTEVMSAPALKITKHAPDWDDEVYSAGFPFGWDEPILSFHWRYIGTETFEEKRFLLFSLAGAPGNSGSPILRKGKVISVWQIGLTPFGAFAGGVETEKMYLFFEPFTK